MENSGQNLYNFYRAIGQATSVHSIQGNGYSGVCSAHGNWPQIIFVNDGTIEPGLLIPKISNDITEKKYPPFIITNKDFIDKTYAPILKENGIIPMIFWKGLTKNISSEIQLKIPNDILIRRLNQPKCYSKFADLVNEELMASQPLAKGLLKELNNIEDIQIYGLFYQGNLASGIMVYYSKGIAGLYFLATKKIYRNNGYAILLIQFLLNELYLNGIEEVILHTNGNAMKLYQKLGFKMTAEFTIFRKY